MPLKWQHFKTQSRNLNPATSELFSPVFQKLEQEILPDFMGLMSFQAVLWAQPQQLLTTPWNDPKTPCWTKPFLLFYFFISDYLFWGCKEDYCRMPLQKNSQEEYILETLGGVRRPFVRRFKIFVLWYFVGTEAAPLPWCLRMLAFLFSIHL